MGIETIALVTAAVAASAGAATAGVNLSEARAARKKQETLEDSRKAALAREAADRKDAETRAASGGTRVGRSARVDLLSSLGFGSGNTTPSNNVGNLFGN